MRRPQKFDWFYRTAAWTKARSMALSRDNHMCQHCLKEGEITSADVVHHIIYVEKDLTKALTLDNLICLCHAHHNDIHKNDDKRNPKKARERSRKIRIETI